MTKRSSKEKSKDDDIVKLKIKYHVPDNIITRFATNMTIQSIENEFKVSFFELVPEIYLKESGEEPPKEIKAECVSSVIITLDRMQNFIDVLQTRVDQHKESKE